MRQLVIALFMSASLAAAAAAQTATPSQVYGPTMPTERHSVDIPEVKANFEQRSIKDRLEQSLEQTTGFTVQPVLTVKPIRKGANAGLVTLGRGWSIEHQFYANPSDTFSVSGGYDGTGIFGLKLRVPLK